MTRSQRVVLIVFTLLIAWILHITTCEWGFRQPHRAYDEVFVYIHKPEPGERDPTATGLMVDPQSSGRQSQADRRVYRLLVLIFGVAVPIAIVGLDVWLFLSWRQAARAARGLCPGCGYDLKGDRDQPADLCPECGWRRSRSQSP